MTGVFGRGLILCARYGKLVLVAGLVAGLLLPGLATAFRPYLPVMVAGLLFISAFRIGHRAILGHVTQIRLPLVECLVLQLAMPVLVFFALRVAGLGDTGAALAVVLMLAAPSVTGAPNFSILAGHDPAPAMQVLIVGTALFPLTSFPVLWLLGLGGTGDTSIASSVGGLILTILVAVILGFIARHLALPRPSNDQMSQLDGIGVIALAVIVIGLMAGIGPLLEANPRALLGWLGLVFGVNFGLQIVSLLVLKRRTTRAVPLSIISGNRNIALFFLALPSEVVDQLLPFIGCYQLPMYLTPLLLSRLHRQ